MKKVKLFFTAVVLLLATAVATAQNINVSGVVKDADNGEPVSGAAVQLKGSTTVYAMTDALGNYKISVPSKGALVVSCLGFTTVEIPVNGRAVVDIALQPDTQALDDVIVVAFGTTTKEAFTGSASVMKSEELQKRQTTNVANALVGAVAGLQMKGSSGAPGAGAGSMNIRGISSIYSSTEPLVIVDGAPYSASLSNIPQNDIESITVLKDAASAALYGARGAAGVIIVTTKKAKNHDAVVNFESRVGVSSRAIQDYETIDTAAGFYEAYYAQRYNQNIANGADPATANLKANSAMINDLGYNVYTVPKGQNLIGSNGKLNPNATLGRSYKFNGETYYMTPDNWTDLAYRNALRQEYTVSVNGGTDKSSFYASVGYLNEDGIIEFSGYERLTARFKADYQVKKWLKIGANVGYTNSTTTSNPNLSSDYGSTNLFYYTSLIAPIYPAFVRVIGADGNPTVRTDDYGNPQYDYGVAATNYGVARAFLSTGNPLGSNRYNKIYSLGNQFNGNITVDADITPWLRANITTSAIQGQTMRSDYETGLYGPKAGVNGQISKSTSYSLRTNNVQSLTFYKSWGRHDVNVMAGHEYYNTMSKYLFAEGQGLYTAEVQEINAAATKLQTSSSYTSRYNVEGFFTSAQYNYDYRYYLSASYRRDASSYFSKEDGNWWGDFWSVGGAWIINREGFMSGTSGWLDELKLKASIGQQGNDNTSAYAYTDTYDLTKATETTMSPSIRLIGNKDITWETTTNANIGLEFAVLNNRISGAVDVYRKKTSDLLFWISIPESAGSRGYYGNIGDIANTGIDIDINASVVRTKNVGLDLSANFSHNTSKILSLPEQKITENGGFYESSLWYKVGGPLNNYMTYSYAGVNEEGKALYYYDPDLSPAGGKVDDNNVSKPGKIKSAEYVTTEQGEASRYETGTTMPDLFGGFSASLRLWNFDISATFDYQIGGKIYDSRYAKLMTPAASTSNSGQNYHKDWAKSWSETNTDSDIPRWQFGDKYTTLGSDRFLTNASYLNFQSFTVGYNVPSKIFRDKATVRVYVAGENLCFWSARKGLDPRYSFTSGNSLNVYSPVRTISGGVRLTF